MKASSLVAVACCAMVCAAWAKTGAKDVTVKGGTVERQEAGCWKIVCPAGEKQVDVVFPAPASDDSATAMFINFYSPDLTRFSNFILRVFDEKSAGFQRYCFRSYLNAFPPHSGEWCEFRFDRKKGQPMNGGVSVWRRIGNVKFTIEVVSPEGGVVFLGSPRVDRPAALRPAKAGERRLAWCLSDALDHRKNWDETAAFLKEHGFTDMIVLSSRGAHAFYDSVVLARADKWPKEVDNLRDGLAAARKHGLKFHAWMTCWQIRKETPSELKTRFEKEGRYQVSASGELNDGWLCPSDRQNRELMLAGYREFVDRGADGIHFDFIRYPGQHHCFCPRCLKTFSKQMGTTFSCAADVRADPATLKRWQAFRAGLISSVVDKAAHYAHARGKEVSAAVFRNAPTDYTNNGQDWVRWCNEGWLDFVCPMDYVQSPDMFRGYVLRQREWLKSAKTKFFPGIGVSAACPIQNLMEELNFMRENGIDGFTVFPLGKVAERTVFPQLFAQ